MTVSVFGDRLTWKIFICFKKWKSNWQYGHSERVLSYEIQLPFSWLKTMFGAWIAMSKPNWQRSLHASALNEEWRMTVFCSRRFYFAFHVQMDVKLFSDGMRNCLWNANVCSLWEHDQKCDTTVVCFSFFFKKRKKSLCKLLIAFSIKLHIGSARDSFQYADCWMDDVFTELSLWKSAEKHVIKRSMK